MTTSVAENSESKPNSLAFARRPGFAFAMLVGANAMWAFQFTGARIAARELNAVLVTFLPLALATLLVLPFSIPAGSLFSKDHRFLLLDVFLLGTFGIIPAQLGLVFGVERTLASNASVLSLTVPILMAVSAVIFLGEHVTWMRLASFVVAVAGVCLVSANDLGQSHLFRSEYVVGNLLVLICCAGSAFYNSYSRRALAHLSPAQVLVFSFLVADFELLLISLFWDARGWRQLAHLGPGVWWSLGLVAFFSLGASMLLYFAVIQHIEVMRASLSIYLLPVFGLIFSGTILGERLTAPQIAGSCLIFVSSFLIIMQDEKQRLRTEDEHAKLQN
jgi:drug/metabolite transporter (DMT)-like permease